MAVLEVDNLHVFYGNIHALRGLSLKVDTDEIVTLIGANGAGKTTTLNAICSIYPLLEVLSNASVCWQIVDQPAVES